MPEFKCILARHKCGTAVMRRKAPEPRARDPGVGIPVGHVEFVQAQLVSTTKKHATLYQRIQSVQDMQSAWLLLLFCANTRVKCSLWDIPPNEVAEFAAAHDETSWWCFTKLLGLPRDTDRHNVASLSFDFGRCGLQRAWRTRVCQPIGPLGRTACISRWQTQ